MTTRLASVRDYLRLIFRRKHALFVPIVLGLLATIPLWIIIPPKYRAFALIRRTDLVAANSIGSPVSRVSAPSINTLRAEILAWKNLDYVIENIKLSIDPRVPSARERKHRELEKAITIRPINPSSDDRRVDIIGIAVIDADPKRAAAIANSVADKYVSAGQERGKEELKNRRDFNRHTAEEFLKDLQKAEKDLDEFIRLHYVDLPKAKEAVSAKLADLNTRRSVTEGRLVGSRKRLDQIEQQLEEVRLTITRRVPNEINPIAQRLQNDIDERKKLLENLLLQRTESHPEIIRLRSDIATLEKQLRESPEQSDAEREIINPTYQSLIRDQLTTQQEIGSLGAELELLLLEMQANDSRLKSLAEQESSYQDLERSKTIAEEGYKRHNDMYLQANAQFEATVGLYGAQLEVMQSALVPTLAHKADRLKIAMACLGAGFALGLMLVFALEFCDHSLRSMEDAEAFLQIPIFGSISEIVRPEDRVRKQRSLIKVATLLLALMLLLTLILLLAEYIDPGWLKHHMIRLGEKFK